MAPAVLHDIGPMSMEAEHSYQQLQRLLAALSDTHSAHEKLLAWKMHAVPHMHNQDLHGLLADVTAKHTSLKAQHQMLSAVQNRLIDQRHIDHSL